MSRTLASTLLPRLTVAVSLAFGLTSLVFAQEAPHEGDEPRATPPWANRATPEAAGVDEAETPSWIEVETRLHTLLRGVEDDPQGAPRRLSSWTQDFFEQATGETLDAESYVRLTEPLGSGSAGVIPGTINRDDSQPRRPLSGYRCLDQVHRNLVDQLVAVDPQTLMPLVWIHFNAHLEQLEADVPWLSDSSRALTFGLIGRLGAGGEEGRALEAAFRVAWAEHLLGRKVYDDGLRAAEVLERVVDDLAEGQPGRDDARYVAAYLLEKYGYYGRALRHFERLSEVWPDDSEIRLRTAMNRLRQGNTRLGEAELRALAHGKGASPGGDPPPVPDWVRQVAYGELVRSLAREPEEARQLAREALDQFPGDPSLRTQLAFHLRTEDWGETLGQLARIESVGPGSGLSPRGVYDLAREGDLERNRRRIAEALELRLPRLAAALDQVERDWKRWPDLRAVEPACDEWAPEVAASGVAEDVSTAEAASFAPPSPGILDDEEPKVWHYSATPEDAGVALEDVPVAIQAENELLRLLTETLDDPEAAIGELEAFQQSVLDRVATERVDANFMGDAPVTAVPGLNCLRRLEVSVFGQLAAIDPEVQVPLAVLLTDTYRHQVGPPRRTWLTEHSHRTALRLVESYRRGRDPETDDSPVGVRGEAATGESPTPAPLTSEELEARRPLAIALLLVLADQQRRAGSYYDGGEALELFERIVRLDPEHSIARYFAGYLAEKYAFYPRARRHFEALAERHPDDLEARLRLALNQSRTGAKAKAEEGLRWVSGSASGTAAAGDSWLRQLAFHELVRLAGDDPKRASMELAVAQARFPDDPVLRIQSAYHLRQAAWDASVEELYRAEESLGGGEETVRVRYEFPRDDGLAENRAEVERQVALRLPNLRQAVVRLERDWRRWAQLREPIEQCRLLEGEGPEEPESSLPLTW